LCYSRAFQPPPGPLMCHCQPCFPFLLWHSKDLESAHVSIRAGHYWCPRQRASVAQSRQGSSRGRSFFRLPDATGDTPQLLLLQCFLVRLSNASPPLLLALPPVERPALHSPHASCSHRVGLESPALLGFAKQPSVYPLEVDNWRSIKTYMFLHERKFFRSLRILLRHHPHFLHRCHLLHGWRFRPPASGR
jgi:hypothetical protein